MKYIFVVTALLMLLTCCVHKEYNEKEYFNVDLECYNNTKTDRNGKDFILCWVDDSLMFSGVYKTQYDSIYFMDCGPVIANFDKTGMDSVKIKICLLSLDSVLFAGERVVDTTFHYRVDNIPYMSIAVLRPFEHFDIYDPVTCPAAFEID